MSTIWSSSLIKVNDQKREESLKARDGGHLSSMSINKEKETKARPSPA